MMKFKFILKKRKLSTEAIFSYENLLLPELVLGALG